MQTSTTFSAGQAAKITGLKYRALDYMAKTGLVVPAIDAAGKGTQRQYSFRDLVALRTIRDLRAAGISLQASRRVVAWLQVAKGLTSTTEALVTSVLVVDPTGKKEVYFRDGDTAVSALRSPGQAALAIVVPIGELIREVQRAVDALAA